MAPEAKLENVKILACQDLTNQLAVPPDFAILLKKNDSLVRINVHKSILCSRSQTFNDMFLAFDQGSKEENYLELSESNPAGFEIFLYCLYSIKQKPSLTFQEAFDFLDLVQKYQAARDILEIAVGFVCDSFPIDLKDPSVSSKQFIRIYLLWRKCWLNEIETSLATTQMLHQAVQMHFFTAYSFNFKDEKIPYGEQLSYETFLDKDVCSNYSSNDVVDFVKALDSRYRMGFWEVFP